MHRCKPAKSLGNSEEISQSSCHQQKECRSKGLSTSLSRVLYFNKNLDKPEIGENSFIGDERACNYYQRERKGAEFLKVRPKTQRPIVGDTIGGHVRYTYQFDIDIKHCRWLHPSPLLAYFVGLPGTVEPPRHNTCPMSHPKRLIRNIRGNSEKNLKAIARQQIQDIGLGLSISCGTNWKDSGPRSKKLINESWLCFLIQFKGQPRALSRWLLLSRCLICMLSRMHKLESKKRDPEQPYV